MTAMFRAIDIVRKYDMEMSIAFTPTSFNIEELEELQYKIRVNCLLINKN